ncbi:MAG: FadD3 family acyl-CoA ligase [Gammaproteobacteria bacterium]
MNEVFRSIPELISHRALHSPDQIAFKQNKYKIDYFHLDLFSTNLAYSLVEQGLEHHDSVAIWAPNSIEWIVAAIAIHKAGGKIVPINTRMKGLEAEYILNASHAKFLFTVDNFLGQDFGKIAKKQNLSFLQTVIYLNNKNIFINNNPHSLDCLPEIDSQDTADIIFTSGTTGKPKGVMVSHEQNIKVFDYWSTHIGLKDSDRYLIVNPFFHTFGYKAGWLACLIRGCIGFPLDVFDPEAVLSLIHEESITMLPGPPTLYQSLMQSKSFSESNISSLRLGVTGAATIPVQLIHDMRNVLGFETVITAYGLTESTGVVTMCTTVDSAETIANTSGKAIEGVEIKCVNADGIELPPFEAGEILVRGFNVMKGYFEDLKATHDAIDSDGWLHTGDIGFLDESGYLKITDRVKDMFIVGGFNTYPAEIENIMSSNAAIAQVAVIGVPDERMGEVAKAFVILKNQMNISEEALIAWCKENMANYKVPRTIKFVDKLPTNAAGKIMKFELKE